MLVYEKIGSIMLFLCYEVNVDFSYLLDRQGVKLYKNKE